VEEAEDARRVVVNLRTDAPEPTGAILTLSRHGAAALGGALLQVANEKDPPDREFRLRGELEVTGDNGR